MKGIRCIIDVEGDSAETSVTSFSNNVKAWSKSKLAANYRTTHANRSKYLSIIESRPDTFNPSWDTTVTAMKILQPRKTQE